MEQSKHRYWIILGAKVTTQSMKESGKLGGPPIDLCIDKIIGIQNRIAACKTDGSLD